MSLLWRILPMLTPVFWELARRFIRWRFSDPGILVTCSSTGDEYGHRKWNLIVVSKYANKYVMWLLDAKYGPLEEVQVRGRFFEKVSEGNFKVHKNLGKCDFIWSANIPRQLEDIRNLIEDLSLLGRALRFHITSGSPGVVAIAMKIAASGSTFALVPQAYYNGLPGQGDGTTDLSLQEYILAVKVFHAASTPEGRMFYFKLENTGTRLEQFSMRELPKDERKAFLRAVGTLKF